MVHTAYLDDTTINYQQGIQFKNPATNGAVPEGYMTPEEFRTKAKTSLTKILNEHGIY
ncbi:hypothetical protein FACS189421_06120 [Bacteroidia bacterium]|nr:hypothetical protein FACS189421_06120 [Bacteroidia bacterium]GHT03374.1 hypothetical protein FACS189423_04130 [Bacteroidia bacterium]GHT45176.1 hypothetical protein FACS189440_00660 [Bacteroidia bacterium]GHT88043.1 hypothetical protein FACS189474_2450 [Bacteroidia bacterium]